ncbi:MAG: methyltransferase [Armatimonadota bacterium]|nr:methyltransferase [Armatimonadota bacterium]MDR7429414.1 methyltransferase [Armatimonadota bacterium]MDR7432808.1 methyltransferase [Armatimonadota bacterium]MDR7514206.1 methyltransferase [Armatimonadota bacterium]MDR7541010.1 methyltransferase [Armatimonadota bacterium]
MSPRQAAHYFSPAPQVPSRPRVVELEFGGRRFQFLTDRGVFSYRGVDRGTRLLLEALEVGPEDEVLDLGCGYGVVGIVAASLAVRGRAVLVDINPRAVQLARENARRCGVLNVEVLQGDLYEPVAGRTFDVIATNPPIRAGRAVVRAMVEGAPAHLKPGGSFYLVARTAQGAKTLGRLVAEVFGEAEEVERGGGYRVYRGTRRVHGV